MSPPEPLPPGDVPRERYRERSKRLRALGISSLSRDDLTPRLGSEDWDRLIALAEWGLERRRELGYGRPTPE